MTATVDTLKRRADFLRAARGRKAVRPTLVLQAAPKDAADAARFGYTATRKLGGAVVRNRVKRRLREAVRRVAADCIPAGRDYVLIGRATTSRAPFADIVADLRAALNAVAAPSKRQEPKKAVQP